jgi:hemin uptake protein HemP
MSAANRELPPSRAPAAPAAAGAPPVRRIHSRELLGAAAEVEIEHAGHIYRLRRTSLGKLILTK